jgi:hypothetical protein
MPNLELAPKTHDLLYYLENPRIYDSGKLSLVLGSENHPQHVVLIDHFPMAPPLHPILLNLSTYFIRKKRVLFCNFIMLNKETSRFMQRG